MSGPAHTQEANGANAHQGVFSSDLRWLPGGSEYPAETGVHFGAPQPESLCAQPVDASILLCRLVPRQVIELEAHAVIGIGADHAKFSPVGTAWYRLYPEVGVKQARFLSILPLLTCLHLLPTHLFVDRMGCKQ
jgi:hypothetical protein